MAKKVPSPEEIKQFVDEHYSFQLGASIHKDQIWEKFRTQYDVHASCDSKSCFFCRLWTVIPRSCENRKNTILNLEDKMAAKEEPIIDLTQPDSIQKDEFIVDVNKVKLIGDVQHRIQDLFHVTFAYGDKVEDSSVNKQWIQVEGSFNDRQLAKDYVRALCNPMEEECIRYPEELESVLTNRDLQDRIEKQSRAVLRYNKPGEISILGNEELSVTLAYSALEDVIGQHWEPESWDTEHELSTSNQAANRLDAELMRRLSTENGTAVDEDELTSMNNAIKRTILDILITNKDDNQADLDDFGIKPHVVTSQMVAKVTGEETIVSNLMPVTSPRKPQQIGSSLNEAAKQLGQIQIAKDSNVDAGESILPSKTTSGSDQSTYLKKFALDKGFSEEDINKVFSKHGHDIRFHDFYRALNNLDNGPDTAVNTSVNDAKKSPSSDLMDSNIISSHGTKIGSDEKSSMHDSVESDATSPAAHGHPIQSMHSSQVASYIERLCRDGEEEEKIVHIEEHKHRNAERQRLLMQVFEKRKAKIDEDTKLAKTISMDTDDPVVIDLTDQTSKDDVDARWGSRNEGHASFERPDCQQNPAHRSRSPVRYTDNSHPHFNHGRSPSPKRYKVQHLNSPQNWHTQDREQDIQAQFSRRPAIGIKSNLRYIVIDGSNVAFHHGNGEIFSCRGIELCIEYFLKRGHQEITAFVPQWRTRTPYPEYPISDQHLLNDLKKRGYLVFTPSRRVGGKNIVCYDDRYVLRLAQETDGIVVSNDNYRDLWNEKREWRDMIGKRLLMFSFVRDIFMPPDDPLGKDGPTLDQMLQKGDSQDAHQLIRGQERHPYRQQHPFSQRQQQHYPTANPAYSAAGPSFAQPSLMGPYPKQNHRHPNNQHLQNNAWGLQNHWNSQSQKKNVNQHGFRPPHGSRFHGQQSYDSRPRGKQSHGPTNNQSQAMNPGNTDTVDTVDGHGWHQVPTKHHNQPQKPEKTRSDSATKNLLDSLKGVFSEQEDVIKQILSDNPAEEDLNVLSIYVLHHLDNS